MAKRKPMSSIAPEVVGTKVGKLIQPEQIAASGTEHGHQAAIFQWIALEGIDYVRNLSHLFAIPNGGERSQSVAASLKAEGVRAGIPDMCYPLAAPIAGVIGRVYHGLYLELKRPGLEGRALGGRSTQQRDWHVFLAAQGYAVATAYGWQAACWVLKLYIDGDFHMPTNGDCFMAPACPNPPVVKSSP